MQTLNIQSELRKGAIVWYSFKKNSRLLFVLNSKDYADMDYRSLMSEYFQERSVEVTFVSAEDLIAIDTVASGLDYVLGLSVLETAVEPVHLLEKMYQALSETGRILLGTDNRLGIRYFCGARDPFTGRSFDGIENYYKMTGADRAYITGRCYSRDELVSMLKAAGMHNRKFYAAMPTLQETQLVYAENYLPQEELAIRYFPMYDYPDSVFLNEEYLYTDLANNGLFHAMANSYIIECSRDGVFDDTIHATLSLDRGREDSLATVIKESDGSRCVEKRHIYSEGSLKAEKMMEAAEYLRDRGINVVEAAIFDGVYRMPYINAPIAMNYLYELAKRDKDAFIVELDKLVDIILSSSAHVSEDAGDGMGVTLERGYIDLVPLNCFYADGKYLFYDQEFYYENYPANVIIYRTLAIVYGTKQAELDAIVPMSFFFDRYGLTKEKDRWIKLSSKFTDELRHQKELRSYNEKKKCNGRTLFSNRQRLNYSAEMYQKIFVDIFKGAEDKKIVLFGSGKFTERFLVQFRGQYDVYAIVDNNQAKWGTELEGVKIYSPDMLRDMDANERHIIICIKNFVGTVLQLQSMGIEDYHVYDPGVEYPRKQKAVVPEIAVKAIEGQPTPKKPYHIGYIAGVFDLFHIGHLNMFKRAKEQCDYLIVGVVSDKGVVIHKGTEPFVPFEERIEMVRSCRYVDEAVEISFNYGGTKDAHKMYHFDCQFSGSDYVNDPDWLAEKEYLEKNGATMVFFPYTESTSSTKLKKMINERLI